MTIDIWTKISNFQTMVAFSRRFHIILHQRNNQHFNYCQISCTMNFVDMLIFSKLIELHTALGEYLQNSPIFILWNKMNYMYCSCRSCKCSYTEKICVISAGPANFDNFFFLSKEDNYVNLLGKITMLTNISNGTKYTHKANFR